MEESEIPGGRRGWCPTLGGQSRRLHLGARTLTPAFQLFSMLILPRRGGMQGAPFGGVPPFQCPPSKEPSEASPGTWPSLPPGSLGL